MQHKPYHIEENKRIDGTISCAVLTADYAGQQTAKEYEGILYTKESILTPF